MKYTVILTLVALLPGAFLHAQNGWGADASGSVFNRFGTSGATSPGFFGDSEDSGGEGVSLDTATGTEARGTFSSAAALLDDLSNFMSISTRAETFLNASVGAMGEAVDAFTLGGTTNETFTIDVNLSGTLVNSPNDPSPFAGNFANVYIVFERFDSYFEVAQCLGECWTPDDQLSLEQSAGTSVLTGSFNFELAPGETVTVYAQGRSQMYGEDGIADASTTLDIGFSSGTVEKLVRDGSSVAAIPEPGLLGLLFGASGLAFFAFRRRR